MKPIPSFHVLVLVLVLVLVCPDRGFSHKQQPGRWEEAEEKEGKWKTSSVHIRLPVGILRDDIYQRTPNPLPIGLTGL